MKTLFMVLAVLISSLTVPAQTKPAVSDTLTDSTYFISRQQVQELDKFLRSRLTVDEYLKISPLLGTWTDYSAELWKRKRIKPIK